MQWMVRDSAYRDVDIPSLGLLCECETLIEGDWNGTPREARNSYGG